MFGLGVPELIFILLLALLIFGPKRLPEIGRTLGRGMSEFRKASNDLKRTINVELALDEQPAPPVRPYRPSTQLDTLRTPRSAGGAPDAPFDDRPDPEPEPALLDSPVPSAPSEPPGDSSTERT